MTDPENDDEPGASSKGGAGGQADDPGASSQELVEETVVEEEEVDLGPPPPGGSYEELMDAAEAGRRRAEASMSLVHKEHYGLLLANCLFFAGSLAAWRALPYGENNNGGNLTHGLETIRGSLIFALSIYSFWVTAVGLYTKRTVVWPFMLNALFAMWVGLGGVIRGIGSTEWKHAYDVLNDPERTATKNKLDEALAGLSTIAPGYWMLTGGALLVLFLLVKGVVGGAAQARAASGAAEGEGENEGGGGS